MLFSMKLEDSSHRVRCFQNQKDNLRKRERRWRRYSWSIM